MGGSNTFPADGTRQPRFCAFRIRVGLSTHTWSLKTSWWKNVTSTWMQGSSAWITYLSKFNFFCQVIVMCLVPCLAAAPVAVAKPDAANFSAAVTDVREEVLESQLRRHPFRRYQKTPTWSLKNKVCSMHIARRMFSGVIGGVGKHSNDRLKQILGHCDCVRRRAMPVSL